MRLVCRRCSRFHWVRGSRGILRGTPRASMRSQPRSTRHVRCRARTHWRLLSQYTPDTQATMVPSRQRRLDHTARYTARSDPQPTRQSTHRCRFGSDRRSPGRTCKSQGQYSRYTRNRSTPAGTLSKTNRPTAVRIGTHHFPKPRFSHRGSSHLPKAHYTRYTPSDSDPYTPHRSAQCSPGRTYTPQ
jgi:hypothetical protein